MRERGRWGGHRTFKSDDYRLEREKSHMSGRYSRLKGARIQHSFMNIHVLCCFSTNTIDMGGTLVVRGSHDESL